jgi:hypothetical protein
MDLPPPVAEVCDRFLRTAPTGLVAGLYLHGGLAFGEWVDGQSDVDFVAVLSRRPTDDDVDALRGVHEGMTAFSPVHFDGMHVLAADLAADPRSCPDGPTILGGYFSEGVLDPVVAWHELARSGITVHGPPIAGLGVWTSAAVLREHTVTNVDTYWRANAEALAKMPAEGASEEACCWCVLGVARLHHLLVTGEMTSKSAAGRWALGHYPDRWHRVLREALRVREGGADEYAGDRAGRGTDTAGFTAYVVEQALEGPDRLRR